ncbi:M64 family metallopeptidase [Hoylesella oralis]|uniref:M64 family metallopeptidase n=1 Tax=Hoylesella oralis TaxID=28134 RepID=UPI0028ED5BFE|nr:M64 family metallopeptidase [Hoylesella oralis]
MKRFILSLFYLYLCTMAANAQTFGTYFKDSTLRIDYIFAGNSASQNIYVDKLNMLPRWYGKRQRLAEIPVEGNGQITVRSHKTGKVIFRNSFSTLFQEWLSYDEAKTARKSFQNSFLIPMPNDTVDVTVDLKDNRRNITAALTHLVVPSDILIRHIGFSHVTPYVTLQKAKDTTRCIHIAYVAEGYRKDEMHTFLNDAKIAMEALFEHEPFKTLRDKFNIIAVKSPSIDSGTSEPSRGIWKNTALHSHFDTFYSDRYLTTLSINDLHDIMAGTPYEHLIVLVNTDKYGGGGILNSYNLSMTHHPAYRSVVVHEFGHSFAGLGDEYAYEQEQIPMYPHDIEPWEPNLTTLHNFHNKWEKMIDKGTPIPTPPTKNLQKIGVFEGAGYSLKGVYRGQQDCRMRTNEYPEFCAVCKDAIERLIKFYTE